MASATRSAAISTDREIFARDGCIPLTTMTNATRPEPEPDSDQVTQAVSVGLCFTMAAVLLLVLALVP